MALDGAFLRHLKNEIKNDIIDSRVDKIYQPSKDELIFVFRSKNQTKRLLISSKSSNAARIHFTSHIPENPKVPPMICMLFRKKLCGAKLVDVRQPDLERVLFLDFDAKNELSEFVRLTLVVEIMGKYSNTILIDNDYIIVDALKRVSLQMSSKRLLLPGVKYNLPPKQNKISALRDNENVILDSIKKNIGNVYLSKFLLSNIQGISPIVSREIEYSVFNKLDVPISEMTDSDLLNLKENLKKLFSIIKACEGYPISVSDVNGKLLDFSFLDINQYENLGQISKFENFSTLLDEFFYKRDKDERIKVKSLDLRKILKTIKDRISRKIITQTSEIDEYSNCDTLRIYADIINANLYCIDDGTSDVNLVNFYSENDEIVNIKLDPSLTVSQNAQKYYKAYRKAKTAISVLKEQIEISKNELKYISSVFDEISRVENESDLDDIRFELVSQGYLKSSHKDKKNKKTKRSSPLQFISDDGFKIIVGKNNIQNDEITLRKAQKNDIWFHTKDIPGSHTIIICNNNIPPENTLLQAAILAAYHSKGIDSSNVPVDYTKIRNVHKPNGSKPGMVIYEKYNTLYVTPDKDLVDSLKV